MDWPSFTAKRDGKELPLPVSGQNPRSWWNVQATGDYEQDCVMGEAMALEYLNYESQKADGAPALNLIVNDMPHPITGIETGFLTLIAYAAIYGKQEAFRIASYWEEVRAKKIAA